jgi:hypothetical protein
MERRAAFGVEIGEYRGIVRVPCRVFQRLLPERPTPERCVEAYYLQRTRFETMLHWSHNAPPLLIPVDGDNEKTQTSVR